MSHIHLNNERMFIAGKISQTLSTFLTTIIYALGFIVFAAFVLLVYILLPTISSEPMKTAVPPEIKTSKAVDVYFNGEIIGSRGVAIYNLHPKTLTQIERKGLTYLKSLKHGRDSMFHYDSWQIGAPDARLCNQGGFEYRNGFFSDMAEIINDETAYWSAGQAVVIISPKTKRLLICYY